MLTFPQAVLETNLFMEMPQGFDHYYDGKSCVLTLKRSTCGLKQSNYNFYQKLSNDLKQKGILPCENDCSVCASKNLILVGFVEDLLFFSPKKLLIYSCIKSPMEGSENYELIDEGNINKKLGAEIRKDREGTYELKQPRLTKRIMD